MCCLQFVFCPSNGLVVEMFVIMVRFVVVVIFFCDTSSGVYSGSGGFSGAWS